MMVVSIFEKVGGFVFLRRSNLHLFGCSISGGSLRILRSQGAHHRVTAVV